MKKNDGGPAFPNKGDGYGPTHNYDGMTLRQYYAGQALAGLLSDTGLLRADGRDVSSLAVAVADALIADLEKENDE